MITIARAFWPNRAPDKVSRARPKNIAVNNPNRSGEFSNQKIITKTVQSGRKLAVAPGIGSIESISAKSNVETGQTSVLADLFIARAQQDLLFRIDLYRSLAIQEELLDHDPIQLLVQQ